MLVNFHKTSCTSLVLDNWPSLLFSLFLKPLLKPLTQSLRIKCPLKDCPLSFHVTPALPFPPNHYFFQLMIIGFHRDFHEHFVLTKLSTNTPFHPPHPLLYSILSVPIVPSPFLRHQLPCSSFSSWNARILSFKHTIVLKSGFKYQSEKVVFLWV